MTFEAFLVGLGVCLWFRATPWQSQVRRLTVPERAATGLSPALLQLADRVGRATERAGRWAPWSPRCLERALTAALLLRVRAIPCRLVLGVKAGEAFGAHAWLEVHGRAVVGRAEQAAFQELTFWNF